MYIQYVIRIVKRFKWKNVFEIVFAKKIFTCLRTLLNSKCENFRIKSDKTRITVVRSFRMES